MPICKKCHRFKPKRLMRRHQKDCRPSKKEFHHFIMSKGTTHSDVCPCDKCKKRRERKNKKEGNKI